MGRPKKSQVPKVKTPDLPDLPGLPEIKIPDIPKVKLESGLLDKEPDQSAKQSESQTKVEKNKWQFFSAGPSEISTDDSSIIVRTGWNYINLNDYSLTEKEFSQICEENNLLYSSKITY